MDKKKLFQRLLYLIFFILVANFLANKFYWYSSIWYLDMIMHFLGGFWVALAFIYFFSPKISSFSILPLLKVIFFVFLIGLGWELFEFLVYRMVPQYVFDISDTSSDLFFDLTGGFFAFWYFLKRIMLLKENKVE